MLAFASMELAFELIFGAILFALLAWAVLFILGWSLIGILEVLTWLFDGIDTMKRRLSLRLSCLNLRG
jgi:hypothetical protein